MSNDIEPLKAAKSPKKGKLKLLLAVAGALAILITAGGLWASGLFASKGRPTTVQTVLSLHPMFVETPEMVTNLDAGPHRLSFVKVQCKIEVIRPADAAAVTAAMPRITDLIQTYLRETRPEDLRSDAGTYRLREALLLRASLAVADAEIKDVLFEELIVQ